MLTRFGGPAVTLGVFRVKLPNSRGLAKGQIDQDLKGGRAIQKALGAGSRVGKASPTGAGRGRGGYGASAPRGYSVLGGFSAQRAPSAGFTPLAGEVWRGGAATAQSVVLPLPSAAGGTARSKNGKTRKGGGSGGRGSAPLQPPSNRALSAISRFNTIMQEEPQQVRCGPTCDKCTTAGRNPNHDHRICAFVCCFRCRRGGHRGSAYPY